MVSWLVLHFASSHLGTLADVIMKYLNAAVMSSESSTAIQFIYSAIVSGLLGKRYCFCEDNISIFDL